MRTLLILVCKDFALFFRDKTAVALTFLIPVALIYVFGHVFGIHNTDTGPSGIPLAVVNASDNPAAAKMIDALKAEKSFHIITERTLPDQTKRLLTEDDLHQLIRDNQFRFALVIPTDLIAADSFGLRLRILSNPRNDIETQTVTGILQKVIFSNVPELLGQSLQSRAKDFLSPTLLQQFNSRIAVTITDAFGGDPAELEAALAAGDFTLQNASSILATTDANGASAPAQQDFFAEIVKIETLQIVGRDVKSPAATRVVGGWAMMFLLFTLSSSATSVFEEKKAGLYQRLLAGPVTRAQILIGKFCWGVLIGLVQLVTLFLAGQLMFDIDILGHLPNLIMMSLAAAAACTSFGMLLAAIAPTPQVASGLATSLILIMSAIGGAWFPISFMPEFIQTIARFTIVYWAMEGFIQVLWAGDSLSQMLPTLGILTGTAAVVMTVAVWRFNKGRLFE